MTFEDFQRQARRTQNKELTVFEQTMHALHGLASEVGEIHGIFQKTYQGHEIDDKELKKEAGDALWFLAELADARGWSLDDVAEVNIDKLWRRYPTAFDSDRSVHREEHREEHREREQ